MRIGIDARLVYYSQAGIGQYILHLINGLAQIDRENEYVILQSRKDDTTIVQQTELPASLAVDTQPPPARAHIAQHGTDAAGPGSTAQP